MSVLRCRFAPAGEEAGSDLGIPACVAIRLREIRHARVAPRHSSQRARDAKCSTISCRRPSTVPGPHHKSAPGHHRRNQTRIRSMGRSRTMPLPRHCAADRLAPANRKPGKDVSSLLAQVDIHARLAREIVGAVGLEVSAGRAVGVVSAEGSGRRVVDAQ